MNANEPILGRNEDGELLMEAVYWDDENATTELTATEYTTDMYSYVRGDNATDTKQSKWANAKLNPLGKWDEELEGIWVAKYEASMEQSTDGSTWTATKVSADTGDVLTTKAGNTTSEAQIRMVSKPSVNSWRRIHQTNLYKNSEKMYEELGSHEMKNSEWGAVAYLTYSAYGRNENDNLTDNGANMVNSSNLRNKQIYAVGSSDSDANNYTANSGVYGDAVYETSISYSDINSWCAHVSVFPYSSKLFFKRGGNNNGSNQRGLISLA